jgi:isopenicillin-N N-acyltransferase-like protein
MVDESSLIDRLELENQLRNRPSLTLIELSGKPFERGRQYGARLKGPLGKFVDGFLYSSDPMGFQNLSRDLAVRLARKHSPFLEEYSPELLEEMKGIADGSGRLYEEILMVNLMEERSGLTTANGSDWTSNRPGCTGFAATGKATGTGETILGQSWDGNFDSVKWNSSVLLKEKRNVGPDILVYTYPGNIANAGMNSNGISISWTSVPALEYGVGVPTYSIVAEVLRQKRIGDAVEAVMNAKRAGCFQFFIADATEIYSLEATPSDVDVTYSTKYMAHANHYTSEKFRSKQDMSSLGGSTINRCNRMNGIMEENCGSIDLNVCMNAFKDHVNYPYSICQHPVPEENKTFVTYDCWVMMPAKKEWWLARGPACMNEYKKYTL